MQYLVSLISKQTIPNILFIKSIQKIDEYVFITTLQMQQSGNLDWILALCPEISKSRLLLVDESSSADIVQTLDSFIRACTPDAHFVVNLTCGNKLMALAAYECFRGQNSHVFYLPPLQNVIQEIYPSQNPGFRKISYRLSPQEFMSSYGLKVQPEEIELLPVSLLNFMFEFYASSKDQNLSKLMSGMGPSEQSPQLQALKSELCKGLSIAPQQMKESYWLRFVKGAWFEQYLTYHLLQIDPDLKYVTNCKIEKTGILNEIDLAFTSSNQLYTMEAKISAKASEITEFLYKIDSLKNDFGLFPKCFLAVASRLSERKVRNSSSVHNRAKNLNIRLLTYTDLKPDKIRSTMEDLIK